MVEDMKVREGYKNTEVGVIPDDWELTPMGEIFEFKNGLNKGKEYFGQGTPIVNYMDVYKNRGIIAEDINGKVTVTKNEMASHNVKKGDVFFTRTSETREEVGFSSVLLDNINNAVFSGFILRGRPKKDVLLNEYKKYCFSAEFLRREIISKATFTTRALTNGRVLSNINILIPEKQEQKLIAKALTDTDNLIHSIQNLIDKKEKIKKGTMQQLLTGKKRLDGFSGEWENKRLGDITTSYSGGTPLSSNQSYYGGNIKWITSGDLNKHRINNVEGKITSSGLENSSAKMIQSGTLLLALYGATAGVVALSNINAAINQAILAIIPDNDDSTFLYYKLTFMKDYIIKTYTQGGQPNLSGSIIRAIEINIPPLAEQKAISKILSDMDQEIETLKEKLEKYKTIKKGMMQELLTGRIRLI